MLETLYRLERRLRGPGRRCRPVVCICGRTDITVNRARRVQQFWERCVWASPASSKRASGMKWGQHPPAAATCTICCSTMFYQYDFREDGRHSLYPLAHNEGCVAIYSVA